MYPESTLSKGFLSPERNLQSIHHETIWNIYLFLLLILFTWIGMDCFPFPFYVVLIIHLCPFPSLSFTFHFARFTRFHVIRFYWFACIQWCCFKETIGNCKESNNMFLAIIQSNGDMSTQGPWRSCVDRCFGSRVYSTCRQVESCSTCVRCLHWAA